MIYTILVIVVILLLASLRQVNQYQRGVMFTMGRYTGIKNPGWRLVVPIFQSMSKVDMRIKAVDMPEQKTITKDNISVGVNAVIYYKISEASKAILEVEDYYYAVSQLAQTTMRNAVGEVELDELLSSREKVADRIRSIVDVRTEVWGIEVSNVELKDIVLPEDMERVIAKQAEAERERRAVIIQAEGEFSASQKLSEAASVLSAVPGGIAMRTLQTIEKINPDPSKTVIFALPIEFMQGIQSMAEYFKGKK